MSGLDLAQGQRVGLGTAGSAIHRECPLAVDVLCRRIMAEVKAAEHGQLEAQNQQKAALSSRFLFIPLQ